MRETLYSHFCRKIEGDQDVSLVKLLQKELKESIDVFIKENGHRDNKNARRDLIQAFLAIEVTAFVIKSIFPEENSAGAFTNIFFGKEMPIFRNLTAENKKILHNLYVLLPDFSSRAKIESAIQDYNRLKYNYKHVLFPKLNDRLIWKDCFQWIDYQVNSRAGLYKKYLLQVIKHCEYSTRFTEESKVAIYNFRKKEAHVIDLEDYGNEFKDRASTCKTKKLSIDYKIKEPLSISEDDLGIAAFEMDRKESELQIPKEDRNHWAQRVNDVEAYEVIDNGLKKTEILKVNGVQHWVGKLSVGKSTLMDIMAFHLASKKDKVSVLVVKDIAEVCKKVDYFNKIGILTVPLISQFRRSNHIEQYLLTFRTFDKEMYTNKSFYYLNNTCLLQASTGSSGYVDLDETPCYRVYEVKDYNVHLNNSKICPYIYDCPYFNAIRDLPNAKIIVTTPQSLLNIRIPEAFIEDKMSAMEYLIRKSDLFLIDESDKVQDIFDGCFVTDIDLISKSGGWIDKVISELYSKMPLLRKTLEDTDVLSWVNDLSTSAILINRIHNFFVNSENKTVAKDIAGNTFTAYSLWKDLAVYIADRKMEMDAIEKTKADIVIDILLSYYDNFRREFLVDYFPTKLNEVAENITNDTKMKKDIEDFIQLIPQKLKEELEKKEVFKSLKITAIKLKRNINTNQKIRKLIYLIMSVALLEVKLKSVLDGLSNIEARMHLESLQDESILNRVSNEYRGIVPIPPIGFQYGFRYSVNDQNKNDVSFKLFRYTGVGRYLLYNVSTMFETIDESRGAHCILLSGTSFCPGSPKYHIDLPVKYMLKTKGWNEPEIEYEFIRNIQVRVSGSEDQDEKINSLERVINYLSSKETVFGVGKDYVDRILDRCEEDRKRLLMVVGSYQDAEKVHEFIQRHKHEIESIPLSRNRGISSDNEGRDFFRRQRIDTFAELKKTLLIAPLMSMDRGHNILVNVLDEDKICKKAAFGAAIFLVRPYYVPNDYTLLANRINSWYMSSLHCTDKAGLILNEEIRQLMIEAFKIQKNFEKISLGYSYLGEEERNRLLTDMYINVWQLEGRLIRGNVDAYVYFADASFAPKTAECLENDTEESSMIIGWQKLWQEYLVNPKTEKDKLTKLLLEELYAIRLQGLNKLSLEK